MQMNHAWIAVSLAAIWCCPDSRADEGREIITAIQNDFHKYADYVRKMSMRESWSVSFHGDDLYGYNFERMTDGRNSFMRKDQLYSNYPHRENDPDFHPHSSSAWISRIRGRCRQLFELYRTSPTSSCVVKAEGSYPLTKDNETLSLDEERIDRLPQLVAMQVAPRITTIPQLIRSPGFRLGNVSEDRTGPERLITVEFTIDPSLDAKAATTWVQGGRMQLRPDAYWTLKSGTFQLNERYGSGKLVQSKVTNTFHEDSEKKALPKEVTCVLTVITEDGNKAEEIKRATFEFSSYTQLPEERLSLTQFGMSDRDPVAPKEDPPPSAERDTKNYLAVSRPFSIPAYVWLIAGPVLLLVIDLALLRFWMTKSAKRHDAAVPPPPSAP